MAGCKILIAICFAFISVRSEAASKEDMRNAKKLYERMTGVKVPSTKPELKKVADFLAAGKNTEAAQYITTTSDFMNVQVRNFALRLSNKDQSVNVPFNDFSALVAGVVRDNTDFREILTSDYYYEVAKGASLTEDVRRRVFDTAGLYGQVESAFLNLNDQETLVKKDRQQLVYKALNKVSVDQIEEPANPFVTLKNNPDPAGVLTTRRFAELNLSGGTNRRAVEFSMKQFLCVSMAEAGDANASDQFVGKDVERFPAGDHNKYLTSCKSCHSVMDGMRGAFAKMDYVYFINGVATSRYSQMHGDFYKDNQVRSEYEKYFNDTVIPHYKTTIVDLAYEQKNSEYYKARYNYEMYKLIKANKSKRPPLSQAEMEKIATDELHKTMKTIRDTKALEDLVVSYRASNQSKLNEIRSLVSFRLPANPTQADKDKDALKAGAQTLYDRSCTNQIVDTHLAFCRRPISTELKADGVPTRPYLANVTCNETKKGYRAACQSESLATYQTQCSSDADPAACVESKITSCINSKVNTCVSTVLTTNASVISEVNSCVATMASQSTEVAWQDRNFLICNLNRVAGDVYPLGEKNSAGVLIEGELKSNRKHSELYLYLNGVKKNQNAATVERIEALDKLVQKSRTTDLNLTIAYLEAKGQTIVFARNVFDDTTGVAAKMNKGSYPYGFDTKTDSFVNNANLGNKASFFGWRGSNSSGGQGLKEFGRMVSDSRRFSQCMAKKVYESVCLKPLDATRYSTMVRLGDRFESLNYNLKLLYRDVALDSSCGIIKGK